MTSETAGATMATARAILKQAQYLRTRRLASLLLGIALVLLFVSALYEPTWPWLQWVRAFAEASAIGAIADWYAVAALFGHPLGLPIPHTAIIPEHKNSIGDSLGEFVAQYLITPENVVGKLERYDTAAQLAAWLATPAHATSVATSLTSFLPAFLRAPDDADVRRFFQKNIVPRLFDLDIAKISGKLIGLFVGADLHRSALDRALQVFDRWLSANETLIRTQFAQASKFTPASLDAYIVRKFVEGIRNLVHDIVTHPEHPVRAQFDQAMRSFVLDLEQSPRHRETARGWLRDLAQYCALDQQLHNLRDTVANYAEADLAKPDSALRQYSTALIIALAQGVLHDPIVLKRLNSAWLAFARSTTLQHRGQISALIADVFKSWDAGEVGRKIELEIGRDLQFIRINGALVGGIVGLVLHACTFMLR
jgi:uncharacterized membrane-anchored protein YjiN (DUF445 family)